MGTAAQLQRKLEEVRCDDLLTMLDLIQIKDLVLHPS